MPPLSKEFSTLKYLRDLLYFAIYVLYNQVLWVHKGQPNEQLVSELDLSIMTNALKG